MHSLSIVYHAFLAASSSTKPKASSGSSYASLIFILLIGVLAYFFFLRPRSQQARRQRDTLQEVSVGDEILTGAGIFGRVLDVESDRITIETAPGTRITVLRSTIARRFTEHPPDEEAWSDSHDESDEPDVHGGSDGADGHVAEDEDEDGGDAAVSGESGVR